MSVIDALSRPWAITPGAFDTILAVYERHMSGLPVPASVTAAIGDGRGGGSSDAPYSVENGVAIIPVQGPLAKRMNLFTSISGGTSTQMLVDAIEAADADPNVHSLMLDVDSPGGQVDGTQQVGDAVAAANKPTAAWIDGLGCSAAYWIASQCASVWAASDTSTIGSIGVKMTHIDQSKANEKRGITVTHITAGKYKAAAHPDAPLSDDDRALVQGELDYLYTLFVDTVAEGRGVSPDVVATDMAEGRTFFAQQAEDAGLIDGIISKNDLVSRLAAAHYDRTNGTGSGSIKPRGNPSGAHTMYKTFATEAEYNSEISAAEARGKAAATVTQVQIEAAASAARTEGATAERQRIVALESLPLASAHKDLVAKFKAEGTDVTTATAEVLKAEGALQAKHAADRNAEIPDPVAASAADPAKEAAARQTAEAAVSADAKMDPFAHAAKIKAHVAKAKVEGRTITTVQADAELTALAK